jgi:hypothetical protein
MDKLTRAILQRQAERAAMSTESYTMALRPLISGISVSTLLGAIPWGVFYLMRWIVHGFGG